MIHWNIRRTVTLRAVTPTQAQADRLYRLYLRVMNVWSSSAPTIVAEYARTLSEMRTDSVGTLEATISSAEGGAVSAIFDFRWLFGDWLASIVQWHTQQFVSRMKYATNVDLTSVIGPVSADTLEAVIARNVALVRNVSDQTRDKIAEAVYRGLTQRTPARDVAKEISGIIGGQKARARRIASDQLSKISAALDTSRANEIGLTEWEWQHSGKVHYRPWHKARDGVVYDDRKLPADVKNDQPGFAPFCGCRKRYRISGELGSD